MKATIKVQKEVDLTMMRVEAAVRYWEDATVNGVEDVDGNLIPCREGVMWRPVILLESGKIVGWPIGIKASIHYKVCDAGSYHLLDRDHQKVLSIENDYVPSMLSPGGNGYGDYIIMEIDAYGLIKDWKFEMDGFQNED